MTACLSDALLAGLVEGHLEPSEQASVNAHIDACDECRALVVALVRDPDVSERPTGSGSFPPSFDAPIFEGDERFDVLRLIGAGGMGVVYEVFDHQRDEIVALKTLPSASPVDFLHLKDEFRALADVRHPHLVRLHDLVLSDAHCFFTMERVPGVPLDQALGPLPSTDGPRLRRVFAQLVEAVAELHRRGLLHRDIKPSNVLVTEDDRVVVLDFGLAMQWRADDDAPSSIAGTASYMAPEQIHLGGLSPATDWYAVGGCLFRCLSGHDPFLGETLTALLVEKGGQDATPRPLTHPDESLVDLCLRLLAAEPSDRPDVGMILEALGVQTSPPIASTSLVGREAELARIAEHVTRGEPLVVLGAPGVGKTALVRAALERRRHEKSEGLLFTSRCRPQEHVPFNALDGIVDGIARRMEHDERSCPPPETLAALAELFPSLRPFAPPRRDRSGGASPTYLRRRAFEELTSLLDGLGRLQPTLVFIDDLQWADADSIELLQLLFDDERSWSFVATARTDTLAESLAPPALEPHLTALELAPLSDNESRALLTSLGITEGVEDLLVTADGQPLWLQRLARTRGAEATSLGHLLERQIDELPADAARLLSYVTLAGTPLGLETLAEAAELTVGAARRVSEQLAAELLVRVEPPAETPTIEPYHDRVREVSLRDDAPPRDRLALARALAPRIDRRAQLFACAELANAALDVGTEEDAAVFADINLRAARQSRDATAYGAAALYARSGQGWLRVTHSKQAPSSDALPLLEIEALYLDDRRNEAVARFERAVQGRAGVDQVEHWERRIRLELLTSTPELAMEAAREALSALGTPLPQTPSAPQVARMLAFTQLGTVGRWNGLVRGGDKCPPRVVAEMRLLAATGPVTIITANLPTMVWMTLRNLELSLRHGLAPESAIGMSGYGAVAALTRRYGQAQKAYELARQVASLQTGLHPGVEVAISSWVAPFGEHPAQTERRLVRLETDLKLSGDAYMCTLVRMARLSAAWQRGAPLPELEAIAGSCIHLIDEADLRFAPLRSLLLVLRGTLARLQHGPDLPVPKDAETPMPAFFGHVHEGVVRHHWGQVGEGLTAIRAARRNRGKALGQSNLAHMYAYLILLGCEAHEAGQRTGPSLLLHVAEGLAELRAMARACPENYDFKWRLAWAETQRWRGASVRVVQNAYERAIDATVDSGNLEYEGIARQRWLSHRKRHGLRIELTDVEHMEDVFTRWGSPKRGRQLAESLLEAR